MKKLLALSALFCGVVLFALFGLDRLGPSRPDGASPGSGPGAGGALDAAPELESADTSSRSSVPALPGGNAAATDLAPTLGAELTPPLRSLSGLVRDADWTAAPGSQVHVRLHPSSRELTTVTDESGRFVVELDPDELIRSADVLVTRAARIASRMIYSSQALRADIDAGTLQLRERANVTLRVVDTTGRPQVGTLVRMALGTGGGGQSQQRAETDDRGEVHFGCRPGFAFFTVDGPLAAEERAQIVRGENEFELVLEQPWQVDVHVIGKQSGRGLPGCELSVVWFRFFPSVEGGLELLSGTTAGQPSYVTDEEGLARLLLPTSIENSLSLNVRAPSGQFVAAKEVPRGAGPVTVEIAVDEGKLGDVGYRLVPGSAEVPPDGTEFFTEASPSFLASVREGELMVPAALNTRQSPVLFADGCVVVLPSGREPGDELVVDAALELSVQVTDLAGEPLRDLYITPMKDAWPPLAARKRTDESGRVAWSTLPPIDSVRFSLFLKGQRRVIRQKVDVQLPREIALRIPTFRLRLHVTVEGEPRLPAGLTLRGFASTLDPTEPATFDLVALDVDPGPAALGAMAQGEDAGEHWLELRAPGFGSIRRKVERGDEDLVCDLLRESFLVVSPDELSDARSAVSLQQVVDGAWEDTRSSSLSMPNTPEGDILFSGLGPGHYRVVESESGRFSLGTEFRSGGYRARVVWGARAPALLEVVLQDADPDVRAEIHYRTPAKRWPPEPAGSYDTRRPIRVPLPRVRGIEIQVTLGDHRTPWLPVDQLIDVGVLVVGAP